MSKASKFAWAFARATLGQDVGEMNTYSSRNNWISRCVLGRLVMAAVAAAISVGVYRSLGDGNAARQAMLYILLAVNGFWVLLLSFGSGRNYERICWRQPEYKHAVRFPVEVAPVDDDNGKYLALPTTLPGALHYADSPAEALHGAYAKIDAIVEKEAQS